MRLETHTLPTPLPLHSRCSNSTSNWTCEHSHRLIEVLYKLHKSFKFCWDYIKEHPALVKVARIHMATFYWDYWSIKVITVYPAWQRLSRVFIWGLQNQPLCDHFNWKCFRLSQAVFFSIWDGKTSLGDSHSSIREAGSLKNLSSSCDVESPPQFVSCLMRESSTS